VPGVMRGRVERIPVWGPVHYLEFRQELTLLFLMDTQSFDESSLKIKR